MAFNIDGLAYIGPIDQGCKRQARDVEPTETSWVRKGFASALDQLGVVSITDANGRILHINDEFVRLSRYSRRELLGRTHAILNSAHHSRAFWANAYQTLAKRQTWRAPILNKARDGKLYWVDALIVPLWSRNQLKGFLSVQRDLSEITTLQSKLDERTSALRAIIDAFPGNVAAFDRHHNLILCNKRQKEMMKSSDNVRPTAEALYRANAMNGEYGTGDVDAMVRTRLEIAADSAPHTVEQRRSDGSYVEIRHIPLGAGGFVTTQIDITDRRRDPEMIAGHADRDCLLELPERPQFLDRISEGLERRGQELMALFCINFDNLKLINESWGRHASDALMTSSVQRISRLLSNGDSVARLGDEFGILQIAPKSIDDVEAMARHMITELSVPISIEGADLLPDARIGIAIAPADGNDAKQLIRNAEIGLWRTKSEARGPYGFFEASMDERISQRARMATELRDALADNKFELHYQPIINIKSKRPVACEALLRWSHPERGLVPASEFIPVAEECGLIAPIGDWVLKTACSEASRWPDDVAIAVNISAAQFDGPSLVDKVVTAAKGLPLSRLVLEITETLLMKDRDAAAITLGRLKKLGVRFAIDDFGTGFSSLSYLQSFPFDKIKIDRSFVSNTANQKRSATLRRSIIQLGYNLGMTSVAEGVETQQQLDMLRAEGCVEAQGFLFSRAVPASEIRALFAASH